MRKSYFCRAILFLLLNFIAITSYAWNNSIELGYGRSHDPNDTKHDNSGFLLSGDFYPLWQTPRTHWSLNGAIGQWHSTAPHHNNLTTFALALALRFYPFTFGNDYHAYLLGSAGPAYMSSRKFGNNTQGSNAAFQVNLGLGAEFNPIDVNLRLSHYSNAHLASPDQGFTVLYLLSIGYLF